MFLSRTGLENDKIVSDDVMEDNYKDENYSDSDEEESDDSDYDSSGDEGIAYTVASKDDFVPVEVKTKVKTITNRLSNFLK